uniref:C-type lectin domain containing 1 n=1 Tax=Myripristis murdjan TaxID=586833 RepID=A0A667Z7H2_9TELE
GGFLMMINGMLFYPLSSALLFIQSGALHFRGRTVLCALIGLLICKASAQPTEAPADLQAELSSLRQTLSYVMNRYRLLCDHYTNMASNCSAPVLSCSACPAGWLHVEDKCFSLSEERLDYENSTARCKEMGSHLAIVETKEQHEALEKEARKFGNFFTYYWIGLTDIENEGVWKWVDNTTLKNPFWAEESHQPDNFNNTEHCVVLESSNHKWSDVPCNFIYPRICEMDAFLL